MSSRNGYPSWVNSSTPYSSGVTAMSAFSRRESLAAITVPIASFVRSPSNG